MQGFRIMCHDWLPSGTFVVSKDVYDLLQQQFGVENLDEKFLKQLGIKVDTTPEFLFGKIVHDHRCAKIVRAVTRNTYLPDECTCGAEQAVLSLTNESNKGRSMLNESNKRPDVK